MDRTVFYIGDKPIAVWKGLYEKKHADRIYHDGFSYRATDPKDSFEKDENNEFVHIIRRINLYKQG